jgi:hypothetical protein
MLQGALMAAAVALFVRNVDASTHPPAQTHAQQATPQPKAAAWQYNVVTVPALDDGNVMRTIYPLGMDGWEIVAVVPEPCTGDFRSGCVQGREYKLLTRHAAP